MLQSLKKNFKGILLILVSASCLCSGQLVWKLMRGYEMPKELYYLLLGFFICCVGGIAMVYAYRFGELSVMHPMNSLSYVFSTILSVVILSEELTTLKIIGIVVIISGVVLIGGSDEEAAESDEPAPTEKGGAGEE